MAGIGEHLEAHWKAIGTRDAYGIGLLEIEKEGRHMEEGRAFGEGEFGRGREVGKRRNVGGGS